MENRLTPNADKPAAYRYDTQLPPESALLEELLKQTDIQQLFESYYAQTQIPICIIDLKANVLLSSRWQRICTQFHRVHPVTCQRCIESDTQLAIQLQEGQPYSLYACKNGLTDCASPIIIEGKHVANVFTGQFLTSPPQESWFSQQAAEFGFDVAAYLAALREVPVVAADKIPAIHGMLVRMTSLITRLGIERKNAVESQARQSIILDTIPQSVFWKDLDGRYLGCNAAFAKAVGLTPADIVGKTDYDLPWPHHDAETYRAADQSVIAANEPRLHIIEPLQQADGSRIVIDTSKIPLVDAANKPYGIVGIYEDITERKRNDAVNASRLHLVQFSLTHSQAELLEETLNEAEKLTGSLISFYHFVDADQKTLCLQGWSTRTKEEFCTAAGAATTHYGIDEAGVWVDCVHQKKAVIHNDYASLPNRRGMPEGHAAVIRELVVPVFRGENIAAILGVGNKPNNYDDKDIEVISLLAELAWEIAERKRIEEELQRHRDHLQDIVAERTTALQASEQNLLESVEELKRKKDELLEAKERAEAADRLKSSFLATMSHELRTPLNSIIGFTGILLQKLGGPINEEQEKQLNMVRNSANHLLSLISDILDISKIEAGQLTIASEPFSLSDLITKVVQTVRPLAEKKGLNLTADLAKEVGIHTGDVRRVEQILLNLLSNAVKFTDHGSISVRSVRGRDSYITTVADTGIGIGDDQIERLFKPFHQIDSGLSRIYEGTGLGLSICKRLVELMGGNIRVESCPGKGSSFSFSLPVERT